MPAYARPTRLDDALRQLARGSSRIVAGGTDFYPAHADRPFTDKVLDITALAELRGVRALADHWRIGAATTWSELIEARLPPLFDGLKLAAREVGGRQIQNTGTLGGNLCNASPAADGVPPLLAMEASVELASAQRTRTLPLEQFIIGPRQTALAPDELLAAVLVRKPARAATSGFLKHGARRYLVISIAMVAAVVEHADGIVRSARIAVGACSPVARRLPALERALIDRPFGAEIARCVTPAHLEALAPLDDHRGTGVYRRDAVLVLLRRMLGQMA